MGIPNSNVVSVQVLPATEGTTSKYGVGSFASPQLAVDTPNELPAIVKVIAAGAFLFFLMKRKD